MATSRTAKARAEVEKARLKIAEQQARLKELEAKKTEFENMDIVDIVRGMHIPLDDLTSVLQSLKSSALPAALTSGQTDPKSRKGKAEPQLTENGVDGIDADTTNNETEDKPE